MKANYLIFISLLLALSNAACIDLVDEGIDLTYAPGDAILSVEPITAEKGAIDEVISYRISVSSDVNIKSCIIQSTQPGQNGSGFDVAVPGFDDPFVDHIFGTVQKNVKSFTVKYDYIIPKEISKSRLTFSIIDESGKVSEERVVEVIPGITRYPGQKLYARDRDFHDAFATVNGTVYPDIKTNYSSVTESSVAVQEKIDIIFYYDTQSKSSVLAAPASGWIGLSLNVENVTRFKKVSNTIDFDQLTPGELVDIVEDAAIFSEGSTELNNFRVGDIIGFVTDLNAVFPLKAGLIKVSGLHPSSVPHYSGTSYVLECDIIVQK